MSDDSSNPLLNPRKRAPRTGTSFDFVSVGVPCSQCGKEGDQPLAELAVNDSTDCSYCGAFIDLGDQRWKAKILHLAEIHKQIKMT